MRESFKEKKSIKFSWSNDSNSEESRAMKASTNESKAMSAEMLVSIPIEEGSKKYVTVIALFDTGSSKSLMDEKLIDKKGFSMNETPETVWATEAGSFSTSKEVIIKGVRLPQFTTKRKVEFEFSVFKKNGEYDIILGRDFGQTLGINVINKSRTFEWDNVEIPMVP